jgi:hypothetical protein
VDRWIVRRRGGHVTADGVAIQANMMERPSVWPAMSGLAGALSRSSTGFAALRAAEREGGDIRGRQSAALGLRHARHSALDAPAHVRSTTIAPLDRLERLVRLYLGRHADRAEALGRTGDGEVRRAPARRLRGWRLATARSSWRAIGWRWAGCSSRRRRCSPRRHAKPAMAEFVRRLAASGAQPEVADGARALIGD